MSLIHQSDNKVLGTKDFLFSNNDSLYMCTKKLHNQADPHNTQY